MSLTLDYALSCAEANTSIGTKNLPLLQYAWDSTSLGALKTCPFKYFLSVILGYSGKKKDALEFGIAFHSAMQKYHYAKAEGASHKDSIVAALREGIRSFSETDPDTGLIRIYESGTKERNLYALLRAIVWHLDHHNDNGFREDICKTVVLDNGKPAAELSFRFSPDLNLPAEFTELYLCGHMDHVVTHNDSLYIKDYKTCKSLSSNYFDQYNPDNQMTLYTLAGNIVFGLPVRGVIIDAIQLGVHFARFQRGYSYRTPEQLEGWLEDTEFWLHQAHTCASRNHWPQNDKSCNMYGGCEFRAVCSAPYSLHKQLLDSQFTQRTWDPLQTREA